MAKKCRKNCPCALCSWSRAAQAVGDASVGVAITVVGAVSEPQQQSDTTVNNWAESSQHAASDRRSESIEDGTRDSGNYHGGSSQQ
jgi:hypothetical protein